MQEDLRKRTHKVSKLQIFFESLILPPLLQCWFFLNNSKTVKAVTLENFAACSKISLETSMPNLVSLTCPSLQILGKTQTGVSPISVFLVNPL